MEDFVIIRSQKLREKTALECEIDKAIEAGCVVCVHGGSGVGKTYACERVLKQYSFVHFENQILKTKSETNDLLGKLKGTGTVIYFDDVLLDSSSFSIIFEFLKNPTHVHGPVLFNTRQELRFKSLFKNVEVTYFNIDGPNRRNDIIATTCLKNYGLVVSNNDIEYSTKDNIFDLICIGGSGYQRMFDNRMEEHGHTADVIFTNYKCDSIEDAFSVADAFSRSDVLDTHIYKGMWDAIPYFTLESCVIPSVYIKNSINYSDLIPGAVWTKHCNQGLREKQFRALKSRHVGSIIDNDFISFFMSICSKIESNEIIELCKRYNMESQDLDFMNHLVRTKLKGKALNSVKKHLKKHGFQQRRQGFRQVRN